MTAKIIEFPIVLKAPANCSIHELIDALSESFEALSPHLQKEFQRRTRDAKTGEDHETGENHG